MQDKQARIEVEQKKVRIMEADKAKLDRMAELMKRATEAMAAGKYEEAEAAAKLAMEVDPNDPTPAAIAWKARAEGSYKRNLDISQEKERTFTDAMLDVDRSAIAPRGILENGVSYPRSFMEMSQRRAGKYDLYPRKSAQTLEIEKKLNEPITINFDKASLNEVADFIGMSTGLNVVIDPKALIEESVTSASTVTLKLNEVKLRQALKLLLGPLNLTYKEDDGVLLITSPQSKRTDLVQRVYDVADLVIGPDRGPADANRPQGAGAPGGTTIPDPNDPIDRKSGG